MTDSNAAISELRRSFSWRVLAAVFGLLSTLLLTVVVVRTLEPREAATFFAILAALAFGSKIGCLGLGPNLIRLVAAEPDARVGKIIAGTHLQATLLLTCTTAPVIALIGCNALIGRSEFWPVFVITTLLIIIESARLIISDIFTAVGRVRASVAMMHYIRSALALPFVAVVVFALHKPSLVAVLGTYLAVATVQFAVAVVMARKYVLMKRLSAGWSMMRTAVRDGATVFGLDMSEFLMMQGTIWLATAMFSPEVATQYAAAVTLALQVTVLEALAAIALAAPSARLWSVGKRDAVMRMLSNAATLSVFVVVLIVLVMAVFGKAVVEIAYREDMGPAAGLLLIIAMGGLCQAFFKCSSTLLIVNGNIWQAARTGLVLLALAAPCSVAAAYYSGPVALATVTAVGISAMAVGQYVTAVRVVGVSPRAHFNVVAAAKGLVRDRAEDGGDESEPAPTQIGGRHHRPTSTPVVLTVGAGRHRRHTSSRVRVSGGNGRHRRPRSTPTEFTRASGNGHTRGAATLAGHCDAAVRT